MGCDLLMGRDLRNGRDVLTTGGDRRFRALRPVLHPHLMHCPQSLRTVPLCDGGVTYFVEHVGESEGAVREQRAQPQFRGNRDGRLDAIARHTQCAGGAVDLA